MVTHCALSAQHIAKFAKSDPYVYCGDFNIKPGSSMYNLLTQSTIDAKVRARQKQYFLCAALVMHICLLYFCLVKTFFFFCIRNGLPSLCSTKLYTL